MVSQLIKVLLRELAPNGVKGLNLKVEMGILGGLLKRKDWVGKTCLEIPEGMGPWLGLNTDGVIGKPLKIKDLRAVGKAVLLDFWAYSDVNSLRDLPYLKSWQEKYFPLGLVIIGVHTPEFDFEADPR